MKHRNSVALTGVPLAGLVLVAPVSAGAQAQPLRAVARANVACNPWTGAVSVRRSIRRREA
jgi:hypothetical protein